MCRCCAAIGVATALALSGCSGSKLGTHAVAGQVTMQDGDVAALAASHVEFMQLADPLIRASGKISPDGRFVMETLHEGVVHKGVPEGKYKARIVLADEGDEGVPKRGGRSPVHRRFLDFDASKLEFQVPGGDYTVKLTAK
jgi:hypothetical protein